MDKRTTDQIEYLKRLAISRADLQFSLSAITFLSEVEEDQKYNPVELRRFKSYETAFVVSYARPFTENSGSRYKKLSLRKIGFRLEGEQKRLHEKIISLRNRIYAHSDGEFAAVRSDLLKIYELINGVPLHHVQFEEGLHFGKSSEIHETMVMIAKIMHALHEETQRVALEVRDHMPVVTKRSEPY